MRSLRLPVSTVLITGSRTSPRIGSKHPETSASCSSCRSQAFGRTLVHTEPRFANPTCSGFARRHLHLQADWRCPMNAFYPPFSRDCRVEPEDHQESPKSDHGLRPLEAANRSSRILRKLHIPGKNSALVTNQYQGPQASIAGQRCHAQRCQAMRLYVGRVDAPSHVQLHHRPPELGAGRSRLCHVSARCVVKGLQR